jgi:chaperonin GroEL
MLSSESELDKALLQERLAKLTGGIAKLRVIGASSGELKERRDRAEDAVCAVRGALKHGCLYGGGFGLVYVVSKLPSTLVNDQILKPAMMEPVFRLLSNVGVLPSEVNRVLAPLKASAEHFDQTGIAIVYDAANNRHANAANASIYDSTPAVIEAIRNSISIATLLGTLGGVVVFPRDDAFERSDARDESDFKRNADWNPADERP